MKKLSFQRDFKVSLYKKIGEKRTVETLSISNVIVELVVRSGKQFLEKRILTDVNMWSQTRNRETGDLQI